MAPLRAESRAEPFSWVHLSGEDLSITAQFRTPADTSVTMQSIKDLFRGVVDSVLVHSPAQPLACGRTTGQLVVLAYHRVENRVTFRRHVEYLTRSRTIISAGEVFAACRTPVQALPPDAVLITFDDADRTLLRDGLPVLQEHRAQALAFVVAGHLGTRRPFWWREVELLLGAGAISPGYPSNPQEMVRILKRLPDAERRRAIRELRRSAPTAIAEEGQLTEHELRTLSAGGVEIGNHTMTHPVLDRCSSRRIRSEIVRTHRKLTDIIGVPIRAFAYPNGNWHADAERTLQELEYEGGFLFDHRCSDSPPENRLRISRVRVSSSTPLNRFRLILSGLHPMIHHAAGRS